MISAIAVDDESMALEVVKSHASKVPYLHLQQTFTNAIMALEYLKENPVQVIFLDINMPDISGVDLATLLPKSTQVIFTTAYSDYAVQGFELDALDYLLKPFSFGRFLKACQKAQEWFELQPDSEPAFIFIKTSEGEVKIKFNELLFCEASGNYVNFQLEDKKYLSRLTLAEAESLLPSYLIRTHRSFLANIRKVERLERHQVVLGGKAVPLSSSFSDEFREKLSEISSK